MFATSAAFASTLQVGGGAPAREAMWPPVPRFVLSHLRGLYIPITKDYPQKDGFDTFPEVMHVVPVECRAPMYLQ